MIILKDAYVLTLNPKNEFGRYSILIDEERIADITKSEFSAKTTSEQTKINKWLEQYSNRVEVIDCSNKVIMPPLVNSCLKSDGSLIKYLVRYRGYEKADDNLYTDFMFNYIYQELQTEEMKQDIANIYNYSFSNQLKSGVIYLNEITLRKDSNHLNPISYTQKLTNQKINVCYPIKHDEQTYSSYAHLNPAYYLTDENQLTIYDISLLTELKKNFNVKLFLEVSTNKEVVEKFKNTFSKPVILILNDYGLIDETTTLINPVYLSYDEISLIAEKKATVTICPRDLMFFSNRYFPIDEFINHGIKFNIGTGWLGEDLFKEIRLFRNRHRELNISNEDMLMSVIKSPMELYFNSDTQQEQVCCIAPNKTANLMFLDISDIRFILLPENSSFSKICDFFVDNLSSQNISDIMINGDFKIRDHRLVYINESEIIEKALSTRNKLYKVGKYKEISERTIRREDIEKLDLRYKEEEDIKLFTSFDKEDSMMEKDKSMKEEFRIKGKIPIIRRKSVTGQKTLFENTESSTIVKTEEFQETPEINLLFSEIDETKGIDDEVIYSKIADTKIFRNTGPEKKEEASESAKQESKISLPKNVKLKFGGED